MEGGTQTGLAQFKQRGAKRVRKGHMGGKPKCGSCGFRVRGPNHADGSHHQQGGRVGKAQAIRYRR